jgi:hypothetical protein
MHVIARSGLRDPQGIDDLSTATKPKEYIVKFDTRSADAFGQVEVVVDNAGIPNVVPLTAWQKDRSTAGRAVAMLAFAAALLVAALGARAGDEAARPRPTAERAGTDSVRMQPTAKQFAPPNQPDVSASDASDIDKLYRQLIGPPPATSSDSRLWAAPSDDAAGSVRRWASPR